jgi:Flp pilus assembly protein CpaB
VALQIQPGQRAVAVRVNAECLAGGWVLPGSHVDVSLTTRGAEASTRIFLQNMLVLAVDQTDQRGDGVRNILGQTVTVAATPEEANRLKLASSLGELSLMLRRPGESDTTGHVVTTVADLNKPLSGGKAKEDDIPQVPAASSDFALPKVDEKQTEEDPKPAPVKEKDPAPVRKVVKKDHVMRIRNGHDQRKVRFALNEKEDDDENGGATAEEEKPLKRDEPRKEEKKEDAQPETPSAKPAPAPTTPSGRSTRTPSTKTRGN